MNRVAFATALAVLAAPMHLLFLPAALISPNVLRLFFNAQFFSADVAALLPRVAAAAAGSDTRAA